MSITNFGLHEISKAPVITETALNVALSTPTTELLRSYTIESLPEMGPVTAQASSYGEPFAYRPEDRAVMAVDGDPDTAWSVGDHGDPVGEFIRLTVDGTVYPAIVKEMQRHPVRRDVVHVDFLRVDPDAEIQVEVPITLMGEARQVTAEDGMVDQTLFTLTVQSKPDSIPTELVADIDPTTTGFPSQSLASENTAMPLCSARTWILSSNSAV